MEVKKKNLLILISIPIFILYYCFLYKFCDTAFFIGDILCFSAYIISLSFIMGCANKKVKIVSLLLTHLALITICVFFGSATDLTFQRLYIYFLMCVPSLLVCALLYGLKEVLDEKKRAKAKEEDSSETTMIFEYYLISSVFPLLVLLFLGKVSFSLKYDVSAIFLTVISALAILSYLLLNFKKAIKNDELRYYVLVLCAISLFSCFMYISWANLFVEDTIYLSFPLCVSLVIIFKKFSVFKTIRKGM